ncbi:MAG TPA: DUF2231 domain-containing protein [Tepidisphaeraceae bacterium]|nr:DUF2231 domain-containing protein [Tepidisphaeraceae bacterium]
MKSRAQFKSHPLHPALIAFPIAFLYGCLVADLLGWLLERPSVLAAGGYMSVAAVVSGLIAGVPGFIDYLYVVPPNSSGKKRATQHMIVNLAALALVALGWIFRDWDSMQPGWLTIALELCGAGLVTAGGWMGGTLVYRNEIGVDHRYAHAGKWREQAISGSPGQTIAIDDAADMKPGQMRLLRWTPTDSAEATSTGASQRRLVLARTDEGFAAFDDHCTHSGGSLADGALICNTVQCPWHGSQFDVTTGEVKAGPAEKPISAYRAELREGKVHLTLPSPRDPPPGGS